MLFIIIVQSQCHQTLFLEKLEWESILALYLMFAAALAHSQLVPHLTTVSLRMRANWTGLLRLHLFGSANDALLIVGAFVAVFCSNWLCLGRISPWVCTSSASAIQWPAQCRHLRDPWICWPIVELGCRDSGQCRNDNGLQLLDILKLENLNSRWNQSDRY